MPAPSDPRRKPPLTAFVLRAALEYFGIVFALAFLLGVLRTVVLAPWLGPLPAVLVELPVVLAVAWLAAGRALRRWPVAAGGAPALLAMGALAFALLMLAEAALAPALGGSLAGWLAGFGTAEGAAGLAGQIAFALIPLLRGR
jgi:hypothetical protein